MAGQTVIISVLAETRKFGKQMSAASSVASKLGSGLRKLGKVAGLAFAAAGAAVFGFLATSIKAAGEVERIGAQTAAVIKSTGGAAQRSAKQINTLAGQLEKLSGIDGEVIQTGQNMLLTFTKIKGINFDRATKSVLDLSVATGKDMTASATLVGKALNDPIRGIGALSKVGVQFTEDQKAMIEQMVKAGDVAGAQGVILGELETQYGGSAEAFGDTYLGSIEKVKNAFGNLREDIGARFTEPLRKAFNKVSDALDTLAENPKFIAFMDRVGVFFEELVDKAPGADSIIGSLKKMLPFFMTLGGIFKLIAPVIAEAVKELGPELQKALKELTPSLIDLLKALLPLIPPLVELAIKAVPILVKALALLIPIVTPLIQNFAGLLEAVVLFIDFLAGPKNAASMDTFQEKVRAIAGPFGEVARKANDTGQAIGRFIGGAIARFVAFKTTVTQNIAAAITTITSLPGKVRDGFGNALTLLKTVGSNIIQGLINGIRDKIGSAVTVVKDGVGRIINGAKSVLGIKSPSTVFKQIGRFTVQGLENGLSGTNRLGSIMTGLTRQVSGGFAPELAAPNGYRATSAAGGGNIYNIHLPVGMPSAEAGREIKKSIAEFERMGGV